MKPNRPTVLNNFFLAGVFVALIGLIFLTSGCVVVDFSGEPNPDKRLAMPLNSLPTSGVILSLRDKRRRYINAGSTVYFIAAVDAGLVKIGVTPSLKKCMESLGTMSPVKLTLVCSMPGGKEAMSGIHDRLKAHHSHGGWYYASPDVLDFIRCSRAEQEGAE